jgi:branched-chain amino acid transport system permease protein
MKLLSLGRRQGRNLSIVTVLVLLAVLLFLALVPTLYAKNMFLMNVLILANIWAILAMSWDILSGYTGQISFGHSFFFGLGGYATAMMSVLYGLHPALIVVISGIVAALGGLIVAAPALRMRGPYLALMTLVAALGLDRLMRLLKPQIGIPGAEGAILCIPQCFLTFDVRLKYYYALGLMIVIAAALFALARSRIGLTFEAIRDDEEATQAAGINTAKYKTLAFTISGFVAGISGSFYVYHIGSASPASLLDLERSIEAIVASVIGGMGTIFGPVVGGYFLILTREYLRPLQAWRFFALFALALLILYFIPRGVLPELRYRLRQVFQLLTRLGPNREVPKA